MPKYDCAASYNLRLHTFAYVRATREERIRERGEGNYKKYKLEGRCAYGKVCARTKSLFSRTKQTTTRSGNDERILFWPYQQRAVCLFLCPRDPTALKPSLSPQPNIRTFESEDVHTRVNNDAISGTHSRIEIGSSVPGTDTHWHRGRRKRRNATPPSHGRHSTS